MSQGQPDRSRAEVPFIDLAPTNLALKGRLLDALDDLVDTGAFTDGPAVSQFEQAFAAFCGSRWCVGVSSGLDALRLSLLAAGIEEGDEVILPAMTFVATLEAVTQAGGRPLVVDIAPSDYGLDVEAARAAITSRARFLLPVHLYGQMADMRALGDLARRYGLAVIEDACQAHGARRDGLRAGTAGAAGAFSFYPTKNLGAFGDAGALITDDEALAVRARALRQHGQTAKNRHESEGYTARLDTIQALVLLLKLPFLERWNGERRRLAALYHQALAGVGDLVLPPVPRGSEPVWHLYVVRSAYARRLEAHLSARGIATGRHYPCPPPLTPAFAWLGHRQGEFPVAEALAAEGLSLPIFPGMTEGQLERVTEAVQEFFRHG
jgi:dTDP-4-amino-4,6-dideoxygalactose transaminase